MVSLYKVSAIAGLLSIIVSGPAQAQWSVGGGVVSSDAGYRGIDRDTFFIPVVGYEGERWYFRGIEVGYRLGEPQARSPHQWSLVVTGSPYRFKPGDSNDPQMQQLQRRNLSAEVAVDYKYISWLGTIDARVGQDIRGNGHRMSIHYSYPFIAGENWRIMPRVGVSFISSGYADYYYGVSAAESIVSGLPEYSSQDAFNPFVGVTGMWQINERTTVLAVVNGTRLSSKIADSPMTDKRYTNTVFTAVSYRF